MRPTFPDDELPTGTQPAFMRDLLRIKALIDVMSGPEREMLIDLIVAWRDCDTETRVKINGTAIAAAFSGGSLR